MQNLKFQYARAENFLCFKEIELDLRNYGNIVLIRGIDLDRQEDDGETRKATNGVGKSSIPEIFVYCLYGKCIKQDLKHENVIHTKVGKKLYAEVIWNEFRVVRTRKPDSLRIWESPSHTWDDSTEITLGGMPATQQLIEDKVGLSYNSFVNTVVFTDDNKNSFLECNVPTKREIVENLLSLSVYREYSERAKKTRSAFNSTIATMERDYNGLVTHCDSLKNRAAQVVRQEGEWTQQKKREHDAIVASIDSKKKQLSSSDTGALLVKYNEAQDGIKTYTDSLPDIQANIAKVKGIITGIEAKLSGHRQDKDAAYTQWKVCDSKIKSYKSQIDTANNNIANFKNKIGKKCPTCLGDVKEDNFANIIHDEEVKITNLNNEMPAVVAEQAEHLKKTEEAQKGIETMLKTMGVAEAKLSEFQTKENDAQRGILNLSKIKKPESGTDEKVLEGQIEELKKQLEAKKVEMNGPTPFVEIIRSSKVEIEAKTQECTTKKNELDEAEKKLPYYDFWVKAFGDGGIRRFVVDGIIPALNNRVAHWLQFLIDGKFKLTFDNELEATIDANPKDGNSFVYYGLSGGEKRRINLAISQAFAYIRTINSGADTSLVFLDEVTTNIDPDGVECVYNMIKELARTKQVFVTTHDRDLQELLAGAETINLVKKDRFTTLDK